jgi:hypothetical protein
MDVTQRVVSGQRASARVVCTSPLFRCLVHSASRPPRAAHREQQQRKARCAEVSPHCRPAAERAAPAARSCWAGDGLRRAAAIGGRLPVAGMCAGCGGAGARAIFWPTSSCAFAQRCPRDPGVCCSGGGGTCTSDFPTCSGFSAARAGLRAGLRRLAAAPTLVASLVTRPGGRTRRCRRAARALDAGLGAVAELPVVAVGRDAALACIAGAVAVRVGLFWVRYVDAVVVSTSCCTRRSYRRRNSLCPLDPYRPTARTSVRAHRLRCWKA